MSTDTATTPRRITEIAARLFDAARDHDTLALAGNPLAAIQTQVENEMHYADIAREIGGPDVQMHELRAASIMAIGAALTCDDPSAELWALAELDA